MAKTAVVTMRRQSVDPGVTHSTRTNPGPTHLADEQGVQHLIINVTCGHCLQQYQAIGDHDGAYPAERQLAVHSCGADE